MSHRKSGFVVAAFLLAAGCAGLQKGDSKGVFLGDWFDYYRRGIERLDNRDYAGAEKDFRETLAVVSQDTQYKRTYGVHHIPYYAHRELGVALLKLGRPDEAEKELLTSISTAPTGKAKYYLNQSRKARLEATGEDKEPPVISLETLGEAGRVSGFQVVVKGKADDDGFVESIKVNGKKIYIEPAEPSVAFEKEIELTEGENEIVVEAVDLLGKTTRVTQTLSSDVSGPTLAVLESKFENGQLSIVGKAYDDGAIRLIRIGDELIFEGSEKVREIRLTKPLPAGKNSLPFSLEDVAGNVTQGEIETPAQRVGALGSGPLRVASVGFDRDLLAAVSDNEPPAIRIKEFTENKVYTCYLGRLFLDGIISDKTSLKKVVLSHYRENEPVFENRSLLDVEAPALYWNRLIDLSQLGRHRIVITAEDTTGNSATTTVELVRENEAVRSVGSRLSLSLLPFDSQGSGEMSSVAFDLLESAFVSGKRFRMLERSEIDRILTEHEIAASQLADPKLAVKAGRLLTADLTLIGEIIEKKDSIHILCRVVDVETSRILGNFDVFNESKTLASLTDLSEGLFLKVAYRFPLVEGSVVDKTNKGFYVDRGTKSLLWEGAKIVVYREGEDLVTETGFVVGKKIEEISSGYLENLEEAYSVGVPYEKADLDKIAKNDRIITR